MASFQERECSPRTPKRIYPLLLLSLIYLLNQVTITNSTKIRRCCSAGEVLFANGNRFDCAPAPYEVLELYELDPSTTGLPACSSSGNLTSTPLDLISNDLPSDACLDVLYRTNEPSSLTVLHCAPEKANPKKESRIIQLPRVLPLRRCCSPGEVFNASSRACAPTTQEVPVTSLVAAFGELEYVTLLRGPPMCPDAIMDYQVNVTNINFAAGLLLVSLPLLNGSTVFGLNQDNACVDSNPVKDLLTIRACREPEFCQYHSCVKKCCNEDEAMIGRECRRLPGHVTVMKLHEEIAKVPTRAVNVSLGMLEATDYGVLIGHPCIYNSYAITENENWHITPEGHIYVPGYKAYEYHESCLEFIYNRSEIQDGFYPLVCFEKSSTNEVPRIKYDINVALTLTSCTFLLITLLVYICLPALQNLHGKTLMCHVGSLLVAFLCLALAAFTPPSTESENELSSNSYWTRHCVALGYTMLFAFLSAFSWLNIMCFDIWWTFGGALGAANRTAKGEGHRKRFLCYCLYAWGLPLFISSLGILLDLSNLLSPFLRPNIGDERCWFTKSAFYHGEFIFFIAPVTMQLLVNIVFFVLTARNCSRVKAEIRRLMASPSDPRSRRFRADKTKLIMNVKLFVVMGITWIFEVVSTLLDRYALTLTMNWDYIFYASDCLNCLQGVLIFLLFVLKRKVYHALRRRFGLVKNTKASAAGIQDPFRVRKSASNSTVVSTCIVSSSP